MATNRLYLYDKLSGHFVMLAKVLSGPAYRYPDKEKLTRFFTTCENEIPTSDDLDRYISLTENSYEFERIADYKKQIQ